MNYAIINSLAVDLEALFSLTHRCRPEVCKDHDCCCSYFEIEVYRWEMENIIKMFPAASAYNMFLAGSFPPDEVFREEDHSNFVIRSNRHNYCVLSYEGDSGQPLCTLHTVALEQGISPAGVKPRCCTLWPLVIDEEEPIPELTLHPDAFHFVCNTRREGPRPSLDPGVAGIIEAVWGREFRLKVERAGRKFLK